MAISEIKRLENWAPIVGRWRIDKDNVTFLEPQEDKDKDKKRYIPFGICISDTRMSEGTISTEVEISMDEVTGKFNSGRILLGYRSSRDNYITVGLVGYGYAYAIAEFEPSSGWTGIALEGNELNLSTDVKYCLETRIIGQRIYLSVNGVRVIEHLLKRPLIKGQVGLFTWGSDKVTFSNIMAKVVAPKVFVVMQFTEPYQQLYKEVIQPITKEYGYQAYHVGEVYGPGVILNDIAQGIIDSQIIIAEITPANSNVFYELGYAHALGKPTILLAERGKELPFDITSYRCLFYDNTIAGKTQVEEALRRHLQAIMHE